MVDVAMMAVHVCQMTGRAEMDACYNMVTWNGAKTLGLQDHYGIAIGHPANVIVLDADSPYDAMRRRSIVQYVISQGKLLAETQPAIVTWHC